MKFIPHLVLIPMLSLAVSQQARADEFHFGSAETAAKMVKGSSPDMVHGFLIKQDGNNLVIRVVGGTISVPRSLVYKIVKDSLSVADIEEQEAATKEVLAEANTLRLEYQADEAAERLARLRENTRQRIELDAAQAEEAPQHPADRGLLYDPIIHRSIGPMLDYVVTSYIQKEFGGQIRRHVQRSLRRLRKNHR